jgi:nickel-dependent lactate racemase
MEVEIPYGKEHIRVEIPDEFVADIITSEGVECGFEEDIIQDALSHPINSPTLEGFLEGGKRVLLIVNDGTRATPTSRILDEIWERIEGCNPHFLVAAGTHRAPTEEELKVIFGSHLGDIRERIHIHDSQNSADMVHVGTTKLGTELFINKLAIESDRIVTINSVKPHYFAGFTGGRKSFLPGIAAYESVERNHSHAVSEKAQPMALAGNPVAEDMEDATNLLDRKKIFSIQTVSTPDHRLYFATAGELSGSFAQAVERARVVYSAPLKEKGNIVLTVAPYPMDINLYQSQHAIENAKLALEKPGIIILITKCWDGIGNPSFLELLDRVKIQDDVERILDEGYRLGYHKAARIMKMKRYAELFAVTDLADETVLRAKMRPYQDLQKAVNDAIEHVRSRGLKPRVVVMPAGGITVPVGPP